MSVESDFPSVEAAVVILERAGRFLAEYNPKWETFTLPMSRLRRRPERGEGGRDTAGEAAVRAAAKALGQPLPPSRFPQPVAGFTAPPRIQLRSGRDKQTKRYTYRIFARRVPADAVVRHALGWHVVWLKPDDFLTHNPVSLTAVYVVQHLPEDLFAN